MSTPPPDMSTLQGRDITLSKIRALKEDIVDIVLFLNLELSTAALAHVYLEKLILRNLVRKVSRKVTAAVCLLLALKFNEVPRSEIPPCFCCNVIDESGMRCNSRLFSSRRATLSLACRVRFADG
eukprot:788796-Rhodomonas_salina.1